MPSIPLQLNCFMCRRVQFSTTESDCVIARQSREVDFFFSFGTLILNKSPWRFWYFRWHLSLPRYINYRLGNLRPNSVPLDRPASVGPHLCDNRHYITDCSVLTHHFLSSSSSFLGSKLVYMSAQKICQPCVLGITFNEGRPISKTQDSPSSHCKIVAHSSSYPDCD